MTATDLWLIRHGESTANVAATRAERAGSETIQVDERDADVPLSADGEDQARALGTWMSGLGDVDVIWSSPYRRAVETIGLALSEAGIDRPVLIDERLRDRELGILDLLTRVGVARRHPEEAERRRRLGKYYHRPPGGESWADVALRLRSFLRDAVPDERARVVVVAHDAVAMLVVALLLGWGEEQLLDFAEDHTVLNASVTHLTRVDGMWRLDAFADVTHLEREAAPITVHPGSPDVRPQ